MDSFGTSPSVDTEQTTSSNELTQHEPTQQEDQEVQQRSDSSSTLSVALTSTLTSIQSAMSVVIEKASQLSKLTKLVYVSVFFVVAIFTIIYSTFINKDQTIIKEIKINGTN